MIAPALIFLAVAAAYVQTLGGPFLWDDRLLIIGVPLVESPQSLDAFFGTPFWAGARGFESLGYYRPLVTLSFALDHALHAGNPSGFHLTNLVLHLTNSLLLYALVRRTGARELAAGLAVAGWALLPRLAEAVAWISGRTDLLAALFVFSALLAWGPGLARRALAASLLGVALLAKENAIAALLAFAWAEWATTRGSGPVQRRLGRVALALVLPLVAVAAYMLLRGAMLGLVVGGRSLGPFLRAGSVLDALGTYAMMVLDAFRPRALIGRLGLVELLGVVFGVVVLVALAFALRRARALPPTRLLGVGLALGSLLTVLHLVPIPLRTLAADRFLYLPLAGAAIALAPSIDPLLVRSAVARILGIVVVGALGVRTYARAATWSDEIEFWTTTYLETPHTSSAAAVELGGVFVRGGEHAGALELNRRALEYDDPNRSDARYNVALCLSRLGRAKEARSELERLARGRSRRLAEDVERELAVLDAREGKLDAVAKRLSGAALAQSDAARWLAARLPEIDAERRSIEHKQGLDREHARARVAEVLGDHATASEAWLRVALSADAPQPVVLEAVEHLGLVGTRDALTRATAAYRSRYGVLEPRVAEPLALRMAELERLAWVRQRIGL